MAALLSVAELNSYYGRAHILADVALEVAKGEVVVLLGRNGAGKSTTMKSIIGIVKPASGRVTFDGADLTGRAPHDIARAGLGYVPEDRRIFTDLTVMENLEVGRQRPREGTPQWTPERLFAIFPNLVVSSSAAPSLTIYNAASSEKTLGIMAIIAAIGMPFVLTYTGIVYWVFRGKVELSKLSY